VFVWGIVLFSLIFVFPFFARSESFEEIKNQILMLAQQREGVESQIKTYDDQLAYMQEQLKKNDEEIQKNNEELAKINSELDKQQEYLSENLRAIYEEDQRSLFEKIFGSKTFSDFVDREEYLTTTRINLKEATDKITVLKRDLVKKKQALRNLEKIQGLIRLSIEKQKADKVTELNKINAEEQRIRDRFAEKLSKNANSSYCKKDGKIVRAKYPVFSFPVDCGYISQGFGMTEFAAIDRAYNGSIHNGFDVGVSTGTEIKSVGNGTVYAKGASPSGGWGNWVMVKMDKVRIGDKDIEFYALYSHMITEGLVNVGDKVGPDTLVGWVGGTPYWAPHLHFSLFLTPSDWADKKVGPYPGNTVDPLDYMDIPISTVGTDWDPKYLH
jgi:murein DD-endopeptidase MepM/ murein hydrolase activator NlpD